MALILGVEITTNTFTVIIALKHYSNRFIQSNAILMTVKSDSNHYLPFIDGETEAEFQIRCALGRYYGGGARGQEEV